MREEQKGVKADKTRITYALTTNADGTEKRELLVIGRSAKPTSSGRKSPERFGFYYECNKTAWMTGAIFTVWIKRWDDFLRSQGRKVLLFVDNFSGHKTDALLTNIRLEFFAPNLTAHFQPLDAGIIASFKLQFKRQQLQRAVDLFEMNTPGHLCYKADVHQGMDMGREAFNAVGQRTMANCWRKAGFLGVRDEEGEYLGSSFDEDIELEDLREEDAETLGLEM